MKTLLVALAAFAGLSHGRKTKSKSVSQDVSWLLGLENPLPLGERLVLASDQDSATRKEGQEVYVSDASQLDVSQLTSVTMKPESVLVSLKSESSKSAGSHESTVSQTSEASADDEMLLDLEKSVLALAREGKASDTTKQAVAEIQLLLDNMTTRIFWISDTSKAAVRTARGRIFQCLDDWNATQTNGSYPQTVCTAATNGSTPTPVPTPVPTPAPTTSPAPSSSPTPAPTTSPAPSSSSFLDVSGNSLSFLEMSMGHGQKSDWSSQRGFSSAPSPSSSQSGLTSAPSPSNRFASSPSPSTSSSGGGSSAPSPSTSPSPASSSSPSVATSPSPASSSSPSVATSPSPSGGSGRSSSPSPNWAFATSPSPSTSSGSSSVATSPSPSSSSSPSPSTSPSPSGGGAPSPSTSPSPTGGLTTAPSAFGGSTTAPSASGGTTAPSPGGGGGGPGSRRRSSVPPAPPPLFLVQPASRNADTIYLNHQNGITADTVLKIHAGAANEELVRVSGTGAATPLATSLVYDHAQGEHVAIFGFGADYFNYGRGANCDTNGYCPANYTPTPADIIDPEPHRRCRDREKLAWKKYQIKRAPLYSMGLLRDDLCARFKLNASDSLWPDPREKCAPQSLDGLAKFYNDSYHYYLEIHNRLVQLNRSCQQATDNYNDHAAEAAKWLLAYQRVKAECDRVQDVMDNSACDAMGGLDRCWLGYGACYIRQRDRYLDEWSRANVTATRYMREMRAILRIECLLDALVANSTWEVNSKIANCTNVTYYTHPNVTYLIVDPPDIPCQGVCPGAFPYQPGTTLYEDLFYVPDMSHPCNVHCCFNGSSNYNTEALYVLGNFSKNSCPAGTAHITESSECQSASTFLKSTLNSTIASWQGDEVSPDWPIYCHQVTGLGAPGVWFNNHSAGIQRATARPICKDMYLPGPKAPSSAGSVLCDSTGRTLEQAKAECDKTSGCEVLLDAGCNGTGWVYCQSTLSKILANSTSQTADACTKVKLIR